MRGVKKVGCVNKEVDSFLILLIFSYVLVSVKKRKPEVYRIRAKEVVSTGRVNRIFYIA